MKSVASIIASMKKDYNRTPGIVEIQQGYSKNSIIIFVDRSKLRSVISSTYQGLSISFYDLIGVRDATKAVLEKTDLSLITDAANITTFNYLTKTLTLCEKLLHLELSKKT